MRWAFSVTKEPAMAKAPVTKETEGAPLPSSITLTCPFGYLDDSNVPHMWGAGQVVTDPAEIADLIAHGAEHIDAE
jgi:hypothetical protein